MGGRKDPKNPKASRRARRLVLATLVAVAVVLAAPVLPNWEQVLSMAAERTGGPDAYSPFARFPEADRPDQRFAVVGDVGTGDWYENDTARLVDELGRHDPYDGLILLGDNVYPSGDPLRLGETVFIPFGPVLAAGAELLPVLGNHDVEKGHGDAQATALGMPARWYAARLDDVLIVGLDSTQPANPEQAAWLERILARSTAAWKIVAMHHPPYSSGYHGSDMETRRAFSSLFERYGVHLVLAGHDHDYQRTRSINGVTYVVSGGAAKVRPTGWADFTEAAYSTRHFVDVGVWRDRLVLRAVNREGVFDEVVLYGPACGRDADALLFPSLREGWLRRSLRSRSREPSFPLPQGGVTPAQLAEPESGRVSFSCPPSPGCARHFPLRAPPSAGRPGLAAWLLTPIASLRSALPPEGEESEVKSARARGTATLG